MNEIVRCPLCKAESEADISNVPGVFPCPFCGIEDLLLTKLGEVRCYECGSECRSVVAWNRVSFAVHAERIKALARNMRVENVAATEE